MLNSIQKFFEVVLEYFVILLMVILTVIVIVAVLYRLTGSSLAWYDEVAAILLAWITYYGSALAVLRRRHIGFDSVLLSLATQYAHGRCGGGRTDHGRLLHAAGLGRVCRYGHPWGHVAGLAHLGAGQFHTIRDPRWGGPVCDLPSA